MRISDWSSDVCSSDLSGPASRRPSPWRRAPPRWPRSATSWWLAAVPPASGPRSEERRVGKECVVRVDLGGRRIIKTKTQNKYKQIYTQTEQSLTYPTKLFLNQSPNTYTSSHIH